MVSGWTRARARFRRARRRQTTGSVAGRVATFATCLAAGLMLTTGAISAEGGDLRPSRSRDLVDLMQAESERNAELAQTVASLRAEVDRLAQQAAPTDEFGPQLAELAARADLTAVHGPGVTVTLYDAPLSVKPPGVADELLIVHQQDIQAVVNALWRGGAEAMTLQGQRVTVLTGIKCVGNTVLLHGVPHAPPYVITAIGDPAVLEEALADSETLRIYREYAGVYRLGYEERREEDVTLPGFAGVLKPERAELPG